MRGSIKVVFIDLLMKSGEALPTENSGYGVGGGGDGMTQEEKGPLRFCHWAIFVELKGI